jgi:hypothetical protein
MAVVHEVVKGSTGSRRRPPLGLSYGRQSLGREGVHRLPLVRPRWALLWPSFTRRERVHPAPVGRPRRGSPGRTVTTCQRDLTSAPNRHGHQGTDRADFSGE